MNQPTTLEQIQNFKGKYPKQLWYLFFSEMWELFCYYGMRGMLTSFMVDQLVGLKMDCITESKHNNIKKKILKKVLNYKSHNFYLYQS